MFPILGQDGFMTEVVVHVLQEGYKDGDLKAVLALTVFEVGQTAVEANLGEPISVQEDVPSGFRGGSVENPPGLDLFSAACRRLGSVCVDNTLQARQIDLVNQREDFAPLHVLRYLADCV